MMWQSLVKMMVTVILPCQFCASATLADDVKDTKSVKSVQQKSVQPSQKDLKSQATAEGNSSADLTKASDAYWKKKLDPQVYSVTRCSATEVPFTGKYWNNHEDGIYRCSNCGEVLFDSKDKFESGTGWPSFTKPDGDSVKKRGDTTMGMSREEVVCKHCGAHLGHVFADGPAPTGQRYCINSASLDFKGRKPTAQNVSKKISK